MQYWYSLIVYVWGEYYLCTYFFILHCGDVTTYLLALAIKKQNYRKEFLICLFLILNYHSSLIEQRLTKEHRHA